MTKTIPDNVANKIERSKILTMPVITFASDASVDLSRNGTANCYVVSSAGNYTFKTSVIGNGEEGFLGLSNSVTHFHTAYDFDVYISPLSAKLLWEDVDGLISDVTFTSSLEGTKVSFTASGAEGNAVIAVYSGENGTGDILWSWHIWCTDRPEEENYLNASDKPFVLQDRNLGATSALSSEAYQTYGLFYEWGRKDRSLEVTQRQARRGRLFMEGLSVTRPLRKISWHKCSSLLCRQLL